MDSAHIRFTASGMGTNPMFRIYRNDELLESFTHTGTNDIIDRKVKTQNFWDRFTVRLTNTSAQCIQVNNRISNYVTPNIHTNENLNIVNVISDLGNDEVCNSPSEIYTFRLDGMQQFAEKTTVIWMLNDQEWGRYEFDETLAQGFAAELPTKHNGDFIINAGDSPEFTAFAERYPFHINAEGFPQVGTTFVPGDSLWAIVITRAQCETTGGEKMVKKNFAGIRPNFVPLRNAELVVTPENFDVCKGGNVTFSAEMNHVNFGTIHWYFNNRKVAEGSTFTAQKLLTGDSLYVVLESNYKCATNLPLRSPAKRITVHNLPEITTLNDTIICNGESIQLSIETSAASFAWEADPTLNNLTIKQPIATPGSNANKIYTVTVTDDNGCQSTATLTVHSAPKTEITSHIWLENPADTTVCRGQLTVIRSSFAPTEASAQRVWLKNGFRTTETGAAYSSSAMRNGDVYQLQVTAPLLQTCLPRTAVSNAIEITVEQPVQIRITANETKLCEGESATLEVLGGAHYVWTSEDPSFGEIKAETVTVTPTRTTTYFAQSFSSQSLCFSMDSIRIAVENYVQVALELQLDSRFPNNCETADSAYLFNFLGTNSGEFPRYDVYVNGEFGSWTVGIATFAKHLKPGDQIYGVMTADVVSCRSVTTKSNTITILARPNNPTIEGGNRILCEGETATLAIVNPQHDETYHWFSSKDDFANSIGTGTLMTNQPAAEYRVVAVAENGCENIDQTAVALMAGKQPTARLVLLTPKDKVQTRERIEFRNASSNWVQAFWTFGDEQEAEDNALLVDYTFDTIATYPVVLRLVSEDGCESETTLQLQVLPGLSGVFVPSAFMPNSPNAEDQVLKVYGLDIVSLRFTIYSIDGRELFTTDHPSIGWNGKDKGGREMPTGNYSYMVVVKMATGEEIVRSGTATLIR
jgi:hypothetical protein